MMTNASGGRLVGLVDNRPLEVRAPTRMKDGEKSMSPRRTTSSDGDVRGKGHRDIVAVGTHETDERGKGDRAGRTSGRSTVRFGWESLSETELEVAQLAAEGQTNREIAARLLVSPHTVDSHIRHIYCKLGISSRVQLTRLVLVKGSN
jgi:DNA-binding CsgD family transcriptional regulator